MIRQQVESKRSDSVAGVPALAETESLRLLMLAMKRAMAFRSAVPMAWVFQLRRLLVTVQQPPAFQMVGSTA